VRAKLHAGCDLRKLPVLEREVDVCFGAGLVGNVLPGGVEAARVASVALAKVPVLFGEKRKSQVPAGGIPILQGLARVSGFFRGWRPGKVSRAESPNPVLAKAPGVSPFCSTSMAIAFLPILKARPPHFLDQPCFSATHQGMRVPGCAPELLIKFPNRLVHFSRA